MSHSDEELQHNIENKSDAGNSPDAIAYRKVFDALAREPYTLPANFADRVVSKARFGTGFLTDYFWLGIGLLSFVVAACITTVATGFRPDYKAFRFISGYSGLIVFAVVLIIIIQYLDKHLINRKITWR